MNADDLRLLIPSEVAASWGVKPQTKLCQRGELSYIDVGRGRKKVRRIFEREDVEKSIARRRRTEQSKKGNHRRPTAPFHYRQRAGPPGEKRRG